MFICVFIKNCFYEYFLSLYFKRIKEFGGLKIIKYY